MNDDSYASRLEAVRREYLADIIRRIDVLSAGDGAVYSLVGSTKDTRTLKFMQSEQVSLIQRPPVQPCWLRITWVPHAVLFMEWGSGEVTPHNAAGKNVAGMVADAPSAVAEFVYGYVRKLLLRSQP